MHRNPSELMAEISSLRAELEQARALAEDNGVHAARWAGECDQLQSALRDIQTRRARDEDELQQLRRVLAKTVEAHRADRVMHGNTHEELRIAVEELQSLAQDVEEANAALRKANADLDRRVRERTLELAEANEQLMDRERRLTLALRHAQACSFDWHLESDALRWSGEFERLFGRSLENAPSTRSGWLQLIHPNDRGRVDAHLAALRAGDATELTLEHRVEPPGKGTRWLLMRARRVDAEHPGEDLFLGIATDITAVKAASEALEQANQDLSRRVAEEVRAREDAQSRLFQKQKLEALGQLTGGVAHDFNNLLGVITNSAQLLSFVADDPKKSGQLASRVLSAAMRGAELTRRLLSFSRRQDLRPRVLEAQRTLAESCDLVRHCVRSHVKVECDVASDTWPIWCDPGELQLAILNLGVNARDAMPSGGTITLSARNRTMKAGDQQDLPAGDYVEVIVADTGCGMSEDTVSHVFEPFFTTKAIGEGTGLGLAQVYGFARQSGGATQLESHLGQGTRVGLLLPRATADQIRDHVDSREGAKEDEPGLEGANILVVEDDEILAPLVCEMLRHRHHMVTLVHTAAEALEELARRDPPYDLVFSDVLLPAGMDGMELAREVRRRYPGLPVGLTTGYSGLSRAAPDVQDIPLLRKPYRMEDLDDLVAGLIRSGSHRPRSARLN